MSLQVKLVQCKLQGLIDYLKPFLPLVNCHMTGYITDNLWNTMVPANIRQEIQLHSNVNDAIDLFYELNGKCPSEIKSSEILTNLSDFLINSQKYTIDQMDICLSVEELNERLAECKCSVKRNDPLPIKEFMSAKKRYEVSE